MVTHRLLVNPVFFPEGLPMNLSAEGQHLSWSRRAHAFILTDFINLAVLLHSSSPKGECVWPRSESPQVFVAVENVLLLYMPLKVLFNVNVLAWASCQQTKIQEVGRICISNKPQLISTPLSSLPLPPPLLAGYTAQFQWNKTKGSLSVPPTSSSSPWSFEIGVW